MKLLATAMVTVIPPDGRFPMSLLAGDTLRLDPDPPAEWLAKYPALTEVTQEVLDAQALRLEAIKREQDEAEARAKAWLAEHDVPEEVLDYVRSEMMW